MAELNVTESMAAESYKELLESIKRNTDPTSNTVLLVDDERGIRMKVARDVKSFDNEIVINLELLVADIR